jgi:hypothetical protein
VLTPQNFYEKLMHAQEAMENEQGSYVLLKVKKHSNSLLMENSDRLVREFDYVGMGKDNRMYILLNNISKIDLHHVVKRLQNSGIDTLVVKEEYSI